MNRLPFPPLTAAGLAALADDRTIVTEPWKVYELRRALTDRRLAEVFRVAA